jgi:hypothetical protein
MVKGDVAVPAVSEIDVHAVQLPTRLLNVTKLELPKSIVNAVTISPLKEMKLSGPVRSAVFHDLDPVV